MESPNNDLNVREKISFEIGIKLGALFHQFIGTPVSKKMKNNLENCIEESIKNQPFVKEVDIEIKLKEEEYTSLDPQHLRAKVVVEYKGYKGIGKLEFKQDYPLMWIDKLEEKNS